MERVLLLTAVLVSTLCGKVSAQVTNFINSSSVPQFGTTAQVNGQFQVELPTGAFAPYVLETSADLQNWTPAFTNYGPTNLTLLVASMTKPSGFCRIRPLSAGSAQMGLITYGSISLSGQNVTVDSFDGTNSVVDPGNWDTNHVYVPPPPDFPTIVIDPGHPVIAPRFPFHFDEALSSIHAGTFVDTNAPLPNCIQPFSF